MRRPLAVAGILVAAGALAGCSQVAALAPVGGTRLVEVRFATIDVLEEHAVQVELAPVCRRATDATISCVGTTRDGRRITGISRGSAPDRLTVEVGGDVLHDGPYLPVLDRAAQGTS
ncbi:hypothetical protein [Pseudolysinimonas sp.]|uniref:hypothetical protein n=1 Tax=Pseudolysinimonas sp. TaxID=2680009 RepID=UPI003F821A45